MKPFQGLFAQGIGQSGSSTALWAFDIEPEYNSRAVATKLGCDYPENHTMIVECLREKTAKQIMDAYDEHKVKQARSLFMIVRICMERFTSGRRNVEGQARIWRN